MWTAVQAAQSGSPNPQAALDAAQTAAGKGKN
jgi:multiple sugar transport system substrate-binding protein